MKPTLLEQLCRIPEGTRLRIKNVRPIPCLRSSRITLAVPNLHIGAPMPFVPVTGVTFWTATGMIRRERVSVHRVLVTNDFPVTSDKFPIATSDSSACSVVISLSGLIDLLRRQISSGPRMALAQCSDGQGFDQLKSLSALGKACRSPRSVRRRHSNRPPNARPILF